MTLELRDPRKPGESLGEVTLGFAEALCADIDQIGSDTATRIHDIRVATKKLRALLRLAGDAISPEAVDSIAASLREIRQAFAGSRDEAVLRHRLGELFPDDTGTIIEQLGLSEVPADGLPRTERPRELAGYLTLRLQAVDFSSVTASTLVQNTVRSYRRARRLMKKCRLCPGDDVLMHEWRKRAKDACYHAMVLAAAKPLRKLASPLDDLAESLGEYHDLVLLGERAAGRDLIKAVVAKRRRKLARQCFRDAKKIFRRKPSTLRKNLLNRIAE